MELERNIATRRVLFEKEEKPKFISMYSGVTSMNYGLDAGYIWAPYVPAFVTEVISEPTICSGVTVIYAFTGSRNLSKYALSTVNQDYYSSINLSDF